jgi:hypothetical protein
MQPRHSHCIVRARSFIGAVIALMAPLAAFAAPSVEFDIAPTAECRDVTPPQRIAQYPRERLIEVTLPVSVRFHDASMDDVDELAIEVHGATPGMRVHDFAPTTQLASDISHEIETTTTTNKKRSLDGSLGGTLPVPGADSLAHITPSISAEMSNCDTSTQKINRLPPKHAVVVSGTSSSGRGVFFKLKRYSQTSLEGVHELTVTFVAPRAWKWAEIQVDCAARGERRVLWMKQSGTIGQSSRMVQLVASSAKPIRQTVLKPADADPTTPKAAPASAAKANDAAPNTDQTAAKPQAAAEKSAPASGEKWRSPLHKISSSKVVGQDAVESAAENKKATHTSLNTTEDE